MRTVTSFASLLGRALAGSCALCQDESASAICCQCRVRYLSGVSVRCRRCAETLYHPGAEHCGSCLRSPPAFDATIAACDYAAPVDVLVQDLKFRSSLPLAHVFGEVLAESIAEELDKPPDLIVPVPLSETRLSERGFNQAAEIARSLSSFTGIPFQWDLFIRVRDTRPQAGLPIDDRRVNMRGAFAARLNARVRDQLRGRHVLVVDDVMTTGHTLNELAACLKRQGAARVTNGVFARTPRK